MAVPDNSTPAPDPVTIEVAPDRPQRKKSGPPKGSPQRGGKKHGAKNRRTLEREEAEATVRRRIQLEVEARLKNDALKMAEAQGTVLMKDALFQIAQMNLSLAALYQPDMRGTDGSGKRVNVNPNHDEDKFRYYLNAAKEAAHAGAPFQSPRYSAVMVGATTLTRIEVAGGMPSDFKAPTQIEGTVIEGKVDFAPGTIITADDDEQRPAAKPAAA